MVKKKPGKGDLKSALYFKVNKNFEATKSFQNIFNLLLSFLPGCFRQWQIGRGEALREKDGMKE